MPEASGQDEIQEVEGVLDFSGNSFQAVGADAKDFQWKAAETQLQIVKSRATTKNIVTIILVVAVVASFPAYVTSVYLLPERIQEINAGFQQWLAVIGSLTGAAVGVGVATNRK